MECIFCAIADGSAPASVVCSDELTLAFLDLRPLSPCHVLVVPRRHASRLADLTGAEAAAMMVTAHAVTAALWAATPGIGGVNLLLADGDAADQEVPHVHLHVVPRADGDGIVIDGPAGRPTRAELDRQAATIAAALGAPPR